MSMIPWSQAFSSDSEENNGTNPQTQGLQQQSWDVQFLLVWSPYDYFRDYDLGNLL